MESLRHFKFHVMQDEDGEYYFQVTDQDDEPCGFGRHIQVMIDPQSGYTMITPVIKYQGRVIPPAVPHITADEGWVLETQDMGNEQVNIGIVMDMETGESKKVYEDGRVIGDDDDE